MGVKSLKVLRPRSTYHPHSRAVAFYHLKSTASTNLQPFIAAKPRGNNRPQQAGHDETPNRGSRYILKLHHTGPNRPDTTRPPTGARATYSNYTIPALTGRNHWPPQQGAALPAHSLANHLSEKTKKPKNIQKIINTHPSRNQISITGAFPSCAITTRAAITFQHIEIISLAQNQTIPGRGRETRQ